MKKGLILVLLVILVVVGRVIGKYNNMVTMDETVKESWAQVENQYQRRVDLIPNLVDTVKAYATHEQGTFTAVVEARAKATQTTVDIKDAESLVAFQSSQGELSSALSRLMVVVENYPELKANSNFLELQAQLEGTENRISVERKRYNEMVKEYNIFIRQFPNSFIANIFGFDKAMMFDAEEGAEVAPDVSFEDEKTDAEAKVDNLGNEIEAKKMEIELEKLNQELDAMKEEPQINIKETIGNNIFEVVSNYSSSSPKTLEGTNNSVRFVYYEDINVTFQVNKKTDEIISAKEGKY